MKTDYLKLVADLQARATETAAAFAGVRIALYKTLAAAVLLHRQIINEAPEVLADAYEQAGINFVKNSTDARYYRPWLRLIFAVHAAHGYMSNKLGNYSACMCEMSDEVDGNPEMYEKDGEDRLAQFLEHNGGIHALARKHRGEPIPQDDEDEGAEGNGGTDDDDDDDDKPKPLNPKLIAKKAIELLLGENAASFGTMNPVRPISVAENGLVVMVAMQRPDGLFRVVGTTSSKDVTNRAAVEATVNELGSVPHNLAVLAEVASVAKYPAEALPSGSDAREQWLNKKYFDAIKQRAANTSDVAAAPLTTPREMVVDADNNTVRYSGSGYHRGVVIHCRPVIGLSLSGHRLHLNQGDCARLEGLVDNGVEYLRAAAANDGLLAPKNSIFVENAVTGDQHKFTFADNAADSGCADFDFDQHVPDWTAHLDRRAIDMLGSMMLSTYFTSLGKANQVTRQNNKEWEVRLAKDSISFAHNTDTTDLCEVDSVAASVVFAANKTNASCKVRTKDFGAALYRTVGLPLTAGVEISGNSQAVVLRFDTVLGNYSVAVPTIIANDNAALGAALFVKGN